MPDEVIKEMETALPKTTESGEYIAFFARTRNQFWRSSSTGVPVSCDRNWVAKDELFQIYDDPRTGATLIQSDKSHRYLEVSAIDHKLTATADHAVKEARFTIENDGSILAYNGKYVEIAKDKTELTATGGIAFPFIRFSVKTIAISDAESKIYANLGRYNNRDAAVFDSKTPYQFYWLRDEFGTSYLETSDHRYLYPAGSTEPVTFEKTALGKNNYKVFFEPIEGKSNIYGIKSASSYLYYTSDVIGDKTYLICSARDCKNINAQFKITLNR